MSAKTRWFEIPVRMAVLVAVELDADTPDENAQACAECIACVDGTEPYECVAGRWVAPGVPCVAGPRFTEVFPKKPVAPSKDWNTDGDVPSDKLTGRAS